MDEEDSWTNRRTLAWEAAISRCCHCIAVDPYYLSWKAREYDFHMDFIELAARVNEEMPSYVVIRLLAALYDNAAQGAAQGAESYPSAPGGGHAGGRRVEAPRSS